MIVHLLSISANFLSVVSIKFFFIKIVHYKKVFEKEAAAEAKAAVATVNEPGGRGQREKKEVVKMDL